VATVFISMIVIIILLTAGFANTLSFPSALSKTGGNTTNTTTENMIGDIDSDNDGDNATEMNDSGKISGFLDECPFSFC
jgi:hypothetical protein